MSAPDAVPARIARLAEAIPAELVSAVAGVNCPSANSVEKLTKAPLTGSPAAFRTVAFTVEGVEDVTVELLNVSAMDGDSPTIWTLTLPCRSRLDTDVLALKRSAAFVVGFAGATRVTARPALSVSVEAGVSVTRPLAERKVTT
jgi:hypothetical protein